MTALQSGSAKVVFNVARRMPPAERKRAVALAAKAEIVRRAFERCPGPALRAELDRANEEACAAALPFA